MMALIHDDHSIFFREGFDRFFFPFKQRLHNGDINDPAPRVLACADLTDQMHLFLPPTLFRWLRQYLADIQKLFQRRFPLFE